MGGQYRSHVEEQPRQVRHDTLDILVLLDEPVPLAVGDLTDHVKGVELQPLRKVARLGLVHVQLLGLLEEDLGRVVDKGLVLHQRRHGEGRVHAPPELGVKVVVGGAEERLQRVALDDRLLNDIEVGLDTCMSVSERGQRLGEPAR